MSEEKKSPKRAHFHCREVSDEKKSPNEKRYPNRVDLHYRCGVAVRRKIESEDKLSGRDEEEKAEVSAASVEREMRSSNGFVSGIASKMLHASLHSSALSRHDLDSIKSINSNEYINEGSNESSNEGSNESINESINEPGESQTQPGAVHVRSAIPSDRTAFASIVDADAQHTSASTVASAVAVRDFHEGNYSRIEISIKCRGIRNTDWLSKSDPFCVLHLANEGDDHNIHYDSSALPDLPKLPPARSTELGRTEVIKDCLDPNFTTTIAANFIFEEQQTLIVRIFDEDVENDPDLKKHDFIGYAILTLGKLMSSRGNMLKLPIITPKKKRTKGHIYIHAEKIAACNDQLIFTVTASDLAAPVEKTPILRMKRKLSHRIPRPFLVLSRKNPNGDYTAVWKSDVAKKEIIPSWGAHMTLQRVCNGDIDRPLQFEVFEYDKHGSHKLKGSAQTTVRQLQTLPSLSLKNGTCSDNGQLVIRRADVLEIPSMIDYTSGTCEINFMVAVDFSSSNNFAKKNSSIHPSTGSVSSQPEYFFGLPSESLHFFNQCGFPNEYQAALSTIGSIFKEYGTKCHSFPLYGFGADIGHSNTAEGYDRNCFQVPASNSVPNGEHFADSLDNMLNSYMDVFSDPNFEMTEPTLFAPIIREAAKNARELCATNEQAYTCCLILTDGQINDIDQTIDELVECAPNSPLSIVIVGVGNGDFSDMEKLDGDDEKEGRLVSSKGEVCARDLVQFVPFRKYSTTMSQLTAETLAEVPFQLVNYFMSKGINPSEEVPMADVVF